MSITALSRRIGQAVRAQRLQACMAQRQLAAASGVSERLIRSIEAGEAHGVSLDKLCAVLDKLDLRLFIDNAPAGQPSPEDDYEQLLKQAVSRWTKPDETCQKLAR